MIATIKNFFDQHLKLDAQATSENKDHALKLASAALLIEMTRADDIIKEEEKLSVSRAVQTSFNLSQEETSELIELADAETHQSTCYFEFTSLINKEFSQEQKIKLVEQMWHVAFADGELEKYEEHLVRKISELLYISHKDFIAAKHRAQKGI